MREVRALVAGDLMLDHYIWGSCERISPEAPVQVVKIKNETNARSYQFHTQADIEPTKKALGYEPKFSLEEGIKDYAAEIKRIYEEEINA